MLPGHARHAPARPHALPTVHFASPPLPCCLQHSRARTLPAFCSAHAQLFSCVFFLLDLVLPVACRAGQEGTFATRDRTQVRCARCLRTRLQFCFWVLFLDVHLLPLPPCSLRTRCRYCVPLFTYARHLSHLPMHRTFCAYTHCWFTPAAPLYTLTARARASHHADPLHYHTTILSALTYLAQFSHLLGVARTLVAAWRCAFHRRTACACHASTHSYTFPLPATPPVLVLPRHTPRLLLRLSGISLYLLRTAAHGLRTRDRTRAANSFGFGHVLHTGLRITREQRSPALPPGHFRLSTIPHCTFLSSHANSLRAWTRPPSINTAARAGTHAPDYLPPSAFPIRTSQSSNLLTPSPSSSRELATRPRLTARWHTHLPLFLPRAPLPPPYITQHTYSYHSAAYRGARHTHGRHAARKFHLPICPHGYHSAFTGCTCVHTALPHTCTTHCHHTFHSFLHHPSGTNLHPTPVHTHICTHTTCILHRPPHLRLWLPTLEGQDHCISVHCHTHTHCTCLYTPATLPLQWTQGGFWEPSLHHTHLPTTHCARRYTACCGVEHDAHLVRACLCLPGTPPR